VADEPAAADRAGPCATTPTRSPPATSHNGDEDFVRHLKNARRQKLNVYDEQHRQMHTSPRTPDSPRKIDAAMAGV
jgi:hypothetical protein